MEEPKATQNAATPYLLAFLLTRIPLLWLNKAEHTEAYLYFKWTIFGLSKWHPLYPISIQLLRKIMDPILAGRLISILAGLLCLYYLFALARKVYGSSAAKFTALLFLCFPLGLWVETRVLTESLFIFTCTAAIYSFLKVLEDERPSDFFALIAFSALSALTRPEGTLSCVLIAIAGIKLLKQKRFSVLLYALPAVALWGVFIAWYIVRSQHGVTYNKVAADNWNAITSTQFISYFTSYVEVFPYVFAYVAFGLAFLHVVSPLKRNRTWTATLLAVNAIWLLMLSAHWAWSTRFLMLPATLLLVEAGAELSELREKLRPVQFRAVILVTVFSLVTLASASLFYQRELFADCKEAALFIKTNRTNQRVFSDESIKTSYYLNAPVLNYSRSADFRPGDIIALHSFHTDLRNEALALSHSHKVALVHTASASTIPILANLPLETLSNTNLPVALEERFKTQQFQSIILQILK